MVDCRLWRGSTGIFVDCVSIPIGEGDFSAAVLERVRVLGQAIQTVARQEQAGYWIGIQRTRTLSGGVSAKALNGCQSCTLTTGESAFFSVWRITSGNQSQIRNDI
jgi:hypothetical protein